MLARPRPPRPRPTPTSWTYCAAPGPSPPHLQVWAHGDPLPVVETTDSFSYLPRLTYRLDPAEIEAVRATLAEASLAGSVLVPRRPRTTRI